MIRVFLVDDHELVRTGLRRLLADTGIVDIVGEAESGEEAILQVKQSRPDVVLMDINMPGIGGLEATRKLLQLQHAPRIIIITIHKDGPFPNHLLQAGASGYLSKSSGVDEILTAIQTVHHGERYISFDVAQQMALEWVNNGNGSPFDKLSNRELQVTTMFLQGFKIRDISERLHLSSKTVSTYRSRIFDKLNVNNDSELTRVAMNYGFYYEN